MNEASLWQWLRDVSLPHGHYSRIESHDTAPGHPDVTYQIGLYCAGTIELKYGHGAKVPFPNQAQGLHRTQLAWIRNNLKYWGNVWVIAESGPDIWVIHGSEAEEFNGATIEELQKISVGNLDREDPEKSHYVLHNLLTTWRYDK